MAMLSIVPISWFLGMVPAWFMHPEINHSQPMGMMIITLARLHSHGLFRSTPAPLLPGRRLIRRGGARRVVASQHRGPPHDRCARAPLAAALREPHGLSPALLAAACLLPRAHCCSTPLPPRLTCATYSLPSRVQSCLSRACVWSSTAACSPPFRGRTAASSCTRCGALLLSSHAPRMRLACMPPVLAWVHVRSVPTLALLLCAAFVRSRPTPRARHDGEPARGALTSPHPRSPLASGRAGHVPARGARHAEHVADRPPRGQLHGQGARSALAQPSAAAVPAATRAARRQAELL